jgi:hypothetical protein
MKLNRAATVQLTENLLVRLVEPILKQMEETRIFAAGRILELRKRKVAAIGRAEVAFMDLLVCRPPQESCPPLPALSLFSRNDR